MTVLYILPQIYGCEKSGLFKAFADHVMHHLNVDLHERENAKLRVTLLSRDTQYRRILNEDDLIRALKKNPNYEVQKVKERNKINSSHKQIVAIMYLMILIQ